MAEWPLQLVLLGGRWWLLIEHDAIGQRAPLLEALPIEELHGFPLGARAGCSLAPGGPSRRARWLGIGRCPGEHLNPGGELALGVAHGFG
jgi:hypothetical protein